VLSGSITIPDPPAILHVFGQVPLATLLQVAPNSIGVYTTPTATFPYVIETNPAGPVLTLSGAENSCESVSFVFTSSQQAYATVATGAYIETLTVVQESLAPTSASAPSNTIGGALTAQLVPGQSWSLTASAVGTAGSEVYINGYAVCDSTAPWPATSFVGGDEAH